MPFVLNINIYLKFLVGSMEDHGLVKTPNTKLINPIYPLFVFRLDFVIAIL